VGGCHPLVWILLHFDIVMDLRPLPPSVKQVDSETDEDENVMLRSRRGSSVDPRKVGMDNAFFGDYDMKKSPSTQDFVASYIDDEMAKRNFPGTISKIRSLHDKLHELRDDKNPHIKLELDTAPATTKRQRLMASQLFTTTTEVFNEGFDTIVEDNFWKCFESKKPRPWNWNMYLFPFWLLGFVVRYFFLFPVRLLIFAIGWICFGLGTLIVQGCFKRGPRRTRFEHKLISMMCGVFCMTWGAVIRYHGSPYEPRTGEPHPVYVANHTSMIDVIILQQVRCFSLVGQKHKGIVRFLQETVLGSLQCVWFDRGEIKDRAVVAKTLSEHAQDPTRNPLLVFPEGTCVNNEYLIQFKKGIFEIGVPVLPVAMKYNKMFVDPFWNSRLQSFPQHLIELMTSWVLICDVWYLEPMERLPGEMSEEFAARVKKAIAEQSGLKNVDWDGYMKYWKPSERYLQGRQKVFAEKFRAIVDSMRASQKNDEKFMQESFEDAFEVRKRHNIVSHSTY